MYIPSRPPNSTSSTSNSRQRRPDLSLIKSPHWAYSNNNDPSYPSPPMSDSPTSPRRSSQYPDDRPAGNYPSSSSSAQPRQVLQTHHHTMEGPMLVPPPALQQQFYSQPRAYNPYEQRPELQPRPITTHLPYPPHQYEGYQYQGPPAMPLIPSSRTPMPGTAIFQGGPTSLSGPSGPRVQRTTRRTKQHVAKACQNCKKAHLSCDEARPCARCVSSGKQATCVDVEHKKRGRPRLRDDREQRLEQQAAAAAAAAAQSSGQMSAPNRGHRRENSLRVLRSQGYGSESDDSRPSTSQGMSTGQSYVSVPGPGPSYGSYYASGPPDQSRVSSIGLTAFLNLNLQILKASEGLRSLLGGSSDVIDQPLTEFVTSQYEQNIQRIQNDLRNERSQREPQYLPAIFPDEQERAAARDHNTDEAEFLSRGFIDRSDIFTFRLASGHMENYEVRIRLARTTTFFATMILRRMAPPPTAIAPSPYARGGAYASINDPLSPARSPYGTSTPGSPFSTLPTALMTSLPPPSSIPPSYTYAPPGGRAELGYFGRSGQPSPMYPPPPPHYTPTERRPSTSQEHRRSGPQVQLPPIVSSAPTTPLTSQFLETGVPTTTGSTSRPRSPRTASDNDEEETRKRRRLNIQEIIEK